MAQWPPAGHTEHWALEDLGLLVRGRGALWGTGRSVGGGWWRCVEGEAETGEGRAVLEHPHRAGVCVCVCEGEGEGGEET